MKYGVEPDILQFQFMWARKRELLLSQSFRIADTIVSSRLHLLNLLPPLKSLFSSYLEDIFSLPSTSKLLLTQLSKNV